MSNINKTGFYVVNENFGNEINIGKNIYVSLFIKDFKNDLTINIEENSKVDFYGFFSNFAPKNIVINQQNDNSSLNFKSLFIVKNSSLISSIKSQINSNNSKSNLNIISIVKENKIGIDSSITVSKNSKKIQSVLNLENVFIGKTGTIISIPNLFIQSNDVKVSHSSKSYRIDENKLFYLKSKGLGDKSSIEIILDGYFKKTFSYLEMIDKSIFRKIKNEFSNLN